MLSARTCLGLRDGFFLVAVKPDGTAPNAEYLGGYRVQHAVACQRVNRTAGLELRIKAEKRLRPERAIRIKLLNTRLGVGSSYFGE